MRGVNTMPALMTRARFWRALTIWGESRKFLDQLSVCDLVPLPGNEPREVRELGARVLLARSTENIYDNQRRE